MKNKKVFTFDMDGTLLNSEGKVSAANIAALREVKAAGHYLVLCSGRPYFDMIDIAKLVGGFDYLICNNGTYFYDMRAELFYIDKEVDKSIAFDVFEIGREHKTFFTLHTSKNVYRSKLWAADPAWAADEIRAEWHRFVLIEAARIPLLMATEKILQVSLRATKEIVSMLAKYAEKYQHEADVHVSGEVYLDINPHNTSKLTGITELARHINMRVEDFVAFGDSGNDLQMLRGAGLGIAMSNGTPEAKEAADQVIGDNDSSAIAHKVRELLKKYAN